MQCTMKRTIGEKKMNTSKIIVLVVASIFLLSSVGMVNAAKPADINTDSGNQCTGATATLYITGGPGEHYNTTTLKADKNTCVLIVFHNADSTEHTFTIDSSSDTVNATAFNIYLAGGATGNATYMTPNKDIKLTYYCAIEGHEAAGMKGTLEVGTVKSGSSPGFEALPVVFGLFVAVGVVTAYKKRQH